MSHAAIADLIVPIAKRRGYHAERVTWDDCTRSVVSDGFSFSPLEGLTSSGPCITDSRTVDDEKKPIWMVRSENFNERIGYVKASEVAVVVGNEEATATKNLHSVTLADYLRNFGIYAKHAGAPDSGSLLADALDNTISIRPQVAFVRTGTQFTTNAYVYGSRNPANPQNMVLYCTSQGTSPFAPAGGQGENLYLQTVRPDGTTELSWLKAKESEFSVGAEQKETAETRAAALAQGSAVSMCIGPKILGPKFNVCMMVQLPLKQTEEVRYRGMGFLFGGGGGGGGGYEGGMLCGGGGGNDCGFGASAPGGFSFGGGLNENCISAEDSYALAAAAACIRPTASTRSLVEQREQIGKSSAARVSKGSVESTDWKGLRVNKNWTRHPLHHATITVTFYFAVTGGVPSAADMERAVDELDQFYEKLGRGSRRAYATAVNEVIPAGAGFQFQFAAPADPVFPGESAAPGGADFPTEWAAATPICGTGMDTQAP